MKLFWKLFITLGVAMTLAMVAAVTMGWQIRQSTLEQFFDFGSENREAVIERASQALGRGGREELTAWLRENQTPVPGRRLFIIDDNNEDLLGRDLPASFQFLLNARLERGDNRRYREYGAGRNRVTPQLTDELFASNGDRFRPIFDMTPQITLLNILALPVTQFGVITLAIIMAAGTALLLAKSFSSPIVRLQRATRALAAGALETRVGSPFDRRQDEIGTLARDFDTMAAQLQALVTSKEVLLRDVSHELRSPLARIRVALALAERKVDETAREDLERIDQETERLDQLVGQILTLARLRSSTLEEHADVDLNELLNTVVNDARFEQADASIRFAPKVHVRIPGDAAEIASAVENVLRNAMLHSGPQADIEVTLSSSPSESVITIADRGPGVPEADLKRLFEPFYRVDASRNHKQTGYGLGLAITARILERHGGRIEARNRPGGGLAVSLSFPARPRHH